MTTRLLCIGDIHLGRRPARLPAWVAERVGAEALSPAAAWRLAVEEARRQRVDGVLLAGDVVEQNDDFYEAYRDLRAGVEVLAEAGIEVLGVAGNHDVEVLPRLADEIPDFRLLGRGGTWEACALGGVRVLGWSFPEARVLTSPLALDLPPREGSLPVLGLLHCDRDQGGSPYAPVRGAELAHAPVDAWFLGHIHAPDDLSGPRPIGYLGSLSGLDPGEPGAHGPWQVEVATDAAITARHVALAPLRWERGDVVVDGLEDPDDVHGRVVAAIDALHERIAAAEHLPRAVGCRLRVTGRSAHARAIAATLAATDASALEVVRDGVVYFLDGAPAVAVHPALDLDTLARGRDPAGLLAQHLLVLQRAPGDTERARLVERARHRIEGAIDHAVYGALRPEPPDPERVAALLEQAALAALAELLAQREAPP